jgi:type II secretory pathway pseudopilin PulG
VLFPVLALAAGAGWRAGACRAWLPLAVFKLVVPVLVSLVVIRLTVRVLHRAFPSSAAMRAVERWVSWVAWIAVVLWITGLLPLLLAELDAIQWKIGSTRISVRNLLEGAVTAVVVLVVALWVSAALEQRLLQGATDNLSMRKMAANALRALLLFVGLLFALSAAGIDLTALGVLGGALGVGIGLGLQKLAANYVSGFVILAERSMRIGDIVKVDNFEGRITDITTRYTVIRGSQRARGHRAQRDDDHAAGRELLAGRPQGGADHRGAGGLRHRRGGADAASWWRPWPPCRACWPTPGRRAAVSAFAADGLELTLVFWIADAGNGRATCAATSTWRCCACWAAGVEIPFPQRVVRGGGPQVHVASADMQGEERHCMYPTNHRRRGRAAGMTLVELAVALTLVAVLVALGLPMFQGWRNKARVQQAQNDIIAVSSVIDAFLLDNNRLPANLGEVGRANLQDPWGRAYQYTNLMDASGNGQARKDHSLVPLNTDYDLFSAGPDGSSSPPLTAQGSRDDILRARNGRFVGPASQF